MILYPNAHNNPSVGTMIRAITAYIPQSVHQVPATASFPNHHKAENLQVIDEVVSNSLRIYGSAQELAEHLAVFRNVSCDSELFRKDMCEPYTRIPEVLEATDGSKYMLKQDFLVQLQNIVYAANIANVDLLKISGFTQAFLALFLNLKEQDLRGTREYARCDDSMAEQFETLMREDKEKDELCIETFSIHQFMNMLDTPWNPQKYGTLATVVLDSMTGPMDYVYETCAKLARNLNKIINDRPMIFKPSVGFNFGTTSVIRIFVDKDLGFIPRDEMAAALFGNREPNTGFWKTMPVEKAMQIINSRNYVERLLHPIRFVRVPIIRTKHSAQYIWNRNGVPHKLAIDVFFELLRELMFGVKFFQQIKLDTDFKAFDMFLRRMCDLDPNNEDNFLIGKSKIDEINKFARSFTDYLEGPVSDVRDVGPDGFIRNDLEDELEYLNLTDAFPDIKEHVDIVFAHVVKEKKKEVLRTCDMFDALEHCQLLSFLKKFPKWALFVHNQYGCHRLLKRTCCTGRDGEFSWFASKLADDLEQRTD